jgi:hypothetical protein
VLLNFIGLTAGLILAAIPAGLAFQLLRANKAESKRSARRGGGIINTMLGRAKTTDDWMPDGRVKGGMIYNRKKKRIEVCGRLSNDTLDRVFR